jgi:Spy/CpxP family protein refolding chaperone
MNSRIVIIVLTSIIIIQMIAGLYIINRPHPPDSPELFMEMMDNGRHMGMGKSHMRGNRFGKHFCEPAFMKEKLSLNQDQISRITVLNKKFEEEFAVFRSRIEPEREKLKKILEANTDDMEAIKKQLKKIEDITVEIHLLRIKQGMEISGILTPEQMNILKNERKQFFEKMRGKPDGK